MQSYRICREKQNELNILNSAAVIEIKIWLHYPKPLYIINNKIWKWNEY